MFLLPVLAVALSKYLPLSMIILKIDEESDMFRPYQENRKKDEYKPANSKQNTFVNFEMFYILWHYCQSILRNS